MGIQYDGWHTYGKLLSLQAFAQKIQYMFPDYIYTFIHYPWAEKLWNIIFESKKISYSKLIIKN